MEQDCSFMIKSSRIGVGSIGMSGFEGVEGRFDVC